MGIVTGLDFGSFEVFRSTVFKLNDFSDLSVLTLNMIAFCRLLISLLAG